MKELNKSIENTPESVEAVFEELVNREEFICCGQACAAHAQLI